MKANELRIGNWVTLHGEECRVTAIPPSIQQEFRYEIVYNDGTLVDTMSHLEEDSIQPIPLTEEWLERLPEFVGFDTNFEHGRFEISLNGIVITVFDYVHEYQNVYHALYGT